MNKAIIVILAIAISTALVAQENQETDKTQCTILERLAKLEKIVKDQEQKIDSLSKKRESIFQKHNIILKWTVSSTVTISDIDVGLDNTNAKYLIASVFASHDNNPTADHVNHLFGYSFPIGDPSWVYPNDPIYFNYNDPDSSTYAVLTHGGDACGNPNYYGIHGILIIPLKTNHRMDILLAHGYSSVGKHLIKLRAIAYVE